MRNSDEELGAGPARLGHNGHAANMHVSAELHASLEVRNHAHVPTSVRAHKFIAPLFIRDGHKLIRIEPSDMLFLRSDRNYVEIHVHDRRFVVRNSLEVIMKSLPKGLFVRINRSEAVNILHVDLIGEDEVRIGRQSFSLSRRCRSEMLNQIQVIRSR